MSVTGFCLKSSVNDLVLCVEIVNSNRKQLKLWVNNTFCYKRVDKEKKIK
jgi:hypothetical protein